MRLSPVYSLVESSNETLHRNFKGAADPQRGFHRDGPPRFNLLPVARRESERNHVLLAIARFSAQASDPLPQRPEKLRLIYHA
jgi:hypothetical protein